jgi:hypothetical protein
VKKISIMLVLALSVVLAISGTAQAASLFFDDFDGSSVNTLVWSATANHGSIIVATGIVTLSSSGISFPNIHTINNPFPTTGDFTFEITMSYLSLTGYGSGLIVSGGSSTIFQVWGDSSSPKISINLLGNALVHYNTAPQTLNLKLDYVNGYYTVTANNQVLNAPVSSALRPTSIVLGHPTVTSLDNTPWTSISVDYVKVYQGPDLAVPEYPMGSFLAIGATLAAFSFFRFYKKIK